MKPVPTLAEARKRLKEADNTTFLPDHVREALCAGVAAIDAALATQATAQGAGEQDRLHAQMYLWLRERLIGADFAWGEPATCVWVFETDEPISADLDASISDAMQPTPPAKEQR